MSATSAVLTIHEILERHVISNPSRVAVVDGVQRLSYGELATQVDRIAKALLARGIRKGDRVALLAAPSLDFWRIYLATVSIGAIWNGLNPRYQRFEYTYLLENAQPSLVFAFAPFEGRDYRAELIDAGAASGNVIALDPGGADTDAWREFLAGGARIPDEELVRTRSSVAPEDIAVIVYTSGTTGKPKGAMLSQRAIASAAMVNLEWMGDGLERSICSAPINHVGALNNLCMNVLAYGGMLVFHPRVDQDALADLGRREQPTFIVTSPTGLMMLFANPQHVESRLGMARLIVFGGATTPRTMLERLVRPGVRLSSVYGQTETCGIITFTGPDDDLDAMADAVGRPLRGAEVRIADEHDKPCAPGDKGEIQIRGPYVMSGYFRMPEATREAFTADGFLHTGDLGLLRTDGNLVFVGRLKEMFKSGGYNVYPLEVELAICAHPAIAMSVVTPVPHDVFQEVGHAFVTCREGVSVSADELRAFLRERIANYKIPKSFSFESELPLLPNSKVDRKALKVRALGNSAG